MGIGRGVAERLAAEGAHVAINFRSHPDRAEETAAAVRGHDVQCLLCQADVADRAAMEQIFVDIEQTFGRLDIVVPNAAYSIRRPVIEIEWEEVRRTIDVSQCGVFHACQLGARLMVKRAEAGEPGGKIVIISSLHEEFPFPTASAYNMAKAAINHLGRTMAAELTSYRINVNMINPGWINTPGERKWTTEEIIEERGRALPWGRIGTVEDIANAVAFLASDEADYVTGSTLTIDGGYKVSMVVPAMVGLDVTGQSLE
jgi:glucose 1-dehydrogenase